jgi:hypothetical protein
MESVFKQECNGWTDICIRTVAVTKFDTEFKNANGCQTSGKQF